MIYIRKSRTNRFISNLYVILLIASSFQLPPALAGGRRMICLIGFSQIIIPSNYVWLIIWLKPIPFNLIPREWAKAQSY
jgi:hypothetical protein